VRRILLLVFVVLLASAGRLAGAADVKLPEPQYDSDTSVEEALATRRSVRSYQDVALTLDEIGQILWAAQGITSVWGGRTAPSAGALYPLDVFAVVGNVTGIPPGVYRYVPAEHGLDLHLEGDWLFELSIAARGQVWMADAPVMLVVVADTERTARKYGDRADRYVHIEVGHVCQNVYLQAGALGLGTVIVGSFVDEAVRIRLDIADDPLAIMPVGWPAE
jgi:SagB-type dehydrogenase family enzyme